MHDEDPLPRDPGTTEAAPPTSRPLTRRTALRRMAFMGATAAVAGVTGCISTGYGGYSGGYSSSSYSYSSYGTVYTSYSSLWYGEGPYKGNYRSEFYPGSSRTYTSYSS